MEIYKIRGLVKPMRNHMKIDTTISSSTIPVLYYGSIIPAPSDAEYIAIYRRGYVKVYEEEPKSEQDIESKGDALPFYRSQARKECLSTVAKVQDCSWMADVLLLHGCRRHRSSCSRLGI